MHKFKAAEMIKAQIADVNLRYDAASDVGNDGLCEALIIHEKVLKMELDNVMSTKINNWTDYLTSLNID